MVAPRALPLPLSLSPLLVALACSTVEAPIAARLDAQGMTTVQARVSQGDLRYSAGISSELVLEGRTWGQASDEAVAQERMDAVWWSAQREGSAAVVLVGSTARSSGADLDLVGPRSVDLILEIEDGEIEVEGVTGRHRLAASSVRATDLRGSAWIDAGMGGVSADIWPGQRDTVRVESQGDVHLRLPLGLPYDLQVWGDPAHTVAISDLGFQSVYAADSYFAGTAGPGSVRIDVIAHGGDVIIEPLWSW